MSNDIFFDSTDFGAPELGAVACLTAAERRLAESLCRADQVKGVGATISTPNKSISREAAIRASPCEALRLPTCPPTFVPVTFINAAAPPADPPVVSEPFMQKGLIIGGLLFVVVAGGGYVAYRQTKKRKRRR